MKKGVELLSPVGDFECLKAAVQNGANSVYFGGNLFNARASASNFDYDELEKAINYCALRNVKTHLTLNTLIKNSEFEDAILLAKKAYELGIDALIVQDVGLAQFLMKLFPDLPIHASTQMTIHNLEGVQELEKLGYSRAVLSRELSIQEIEYICANSNIEIETFIHGALCISYSGQCFFSSMVGGRSGNRGRCAQPCRLPYRLIESSISENGHLKAFRNISNTKTSEKIIDKGYLISPRDLCALDFIPSLIDAGVKCFKIEGRLKSPEYVAIVTKIYRKYIDLYESGKEYKVDENDITQLKQAFNRGGFSSGHLSTKANHDLIFKEKPSNMGLYVGNVAGYNRLKGHVKLLLNENLAIGDTINFEKENTKYTISELMIGSSNVPNAKVGSKVVVGRMKGNIHIGDKIYKLSSKTQMDNAHSSYMSEHVKLPVKCNITIKREEPVVMEAAIYGLSDKLYKNISTKIISNLVPEKAINAPMTKERIISQIKKTSDTPFEFEEININMDKDVFIPSIKELNEIRRMALLKLENMIIAKVKRDSLFDEDKLDSIYTKYQNSYLNKMKVYENNVSNTEIENSSSSNKELAIYLNIIHPEFNYSKLSKKYISSVYIPLRFFMRKEYAEALETITSNFKTYIYMPAIIKANYKNVIKHGLEDFIDKFNISGFIVSSLGDFVLLEKYKKKYEFIGNFSLNSFNVNTINIYHNLGIKRVTLSPELNLHDIENIVSIENRHMPLELIVYGNMPVMKMNYCLLGVSNKCYPTCKMRCSTENKYYLRDRLGFQFRILPDNVQTVTTIFNSKTTCITHIDTGINSLRIDLLDETIDEINSIAEAAFKGNKLEGKQYTYGNLNRDV